MTEKIRKNEAVTSPPAVTAGGERRLAAAISLAVLAVGIFTLLAHAVFRGETLGWDDAIFRYFQAHASPLGTHLMRFVSGWASGATLLTICLLGAVAVLFLPGIRIRALSLMVAIGGGELVIDGLKLLFHRARPEAIFVSLGYSFPSGHSFFAVTVYGMLAYWTARRFPRAKRPIVWCAAVLLILLIGFSRIYLCEHYASDVLGGFVAGIPWLWGCLALPALFRVKKNASVE